MGMTLKKEEFKFPVRKTKHSFPDFHIAPIPEIGMEILAVGFVKLKDIDAKHANLARKTGVLSTHVSELSKLIDNGLYKGWAHEPPVINTEGKLIAGKHRFDAHDKSGETEMWVAICSFEGKSVEVDYALSENLRSEPNRESDADDVFFNTIKYFECQDVISTLKRGITKNVIRNRLSRWSWKGGSVDSMVERVYKMFDTTYVTVENPDWSKVVDAWEAEYGVDIVNDINYEMVTLRANGSNTEKTDRWARLRRRLLGPLVAGNNITLIVKLTDSDSNEIISGRKHIQETFMSSWLEEAMDLVVAQGYSTNQNGPNILGTLTWSFVGQLPGEEIIMENVDEVQ